MLKWLGGITNPVTTRIDLVERRVLVPGIVTGAAYAASDTFGQLFEIPDVARVPGGTFVITTAMFYDYDNEGIAKTLHLFRQPVTVAADNAAWAISDAHAAYLMPGGPIKFTSFDTHSNNQTSPAAPALYGVCHPGTASIWGCFQTTGADNIAAGSLPVVSLLVARD